MSTFDYASLRTTAQGLITKFGRSIVLRRTDRTPANSAQPWKGPADPGTNVDLTLDGVFVPPNTVREFGITALGEGTEFRDMLQFSQQIVIISQEVDIRQYETVVDGGAEWNVMATQVLRPGDVYMLGFIGVRR